MLKNITASEAIEHITVDHVTPRTLVVTVKSALPVNLLWPYVRADYTVPQPFRRCSTVHSIPNPDPNNKATAEEAKQRALDDVVWREDRGYVGGTPYAEGWVFAWQGGAV